MATLEQKRAQDAWDCSEKAGRAIGKEYDKYVTLVKGAPALIMNSGLMQVLAFLHEKGLDKKAGKPKEHDPHTIVGNQLREWLQGQCGTPADFEGCMSALMNMNPRDFQAITAEALAWLKWLRQMAAARSGS